MATHPIGWGTPHRAQTHSGSKTYYRIQRQQTYLYLGLPYTKNTKQINLNNVTYIMYKYPTMYRTGSNPCNINMELPIDTIATITTPNFISARTLEGLNLPFLVSCRYSMVCKLAKVLARKKVSWSVNRRNLMRHPTKHDCQLHNTSHYKPNSFEN